MFTSLTNENVHCKLAPMYLFTSREVEYEYYHRKMWNQAWGSTREYILQASGKKSIDISGF